MAVFAITGSICSGKSSLLKFFKRKNIETFDIDKLVHNYYKDKNSLIYKKIKKYFPDAFEGENLQRKVLSKIVFSDPKRLKILEKIVHPTVIKDLKKWIRKVKRKKIAVAEVPLLFEKKLQNHFDGVIVVCSRENILLERIQKKYKISESEANKRLSLFLPIEYKIKKADFVIDNNGDFKNLYSQAEKILEKISKMN